MWEEKGRCGNGTIFRCIATVKQATHKYNRPALTGMIFWYWYWYFLVGWQDLKIALYGADLECLFRQDLSMCRRTVI